MKRHRVFIAINLPETAKKHLLAFETEWLNLPVRWVKKDNLHLTLAFLGYITDEELAYIAQNLKSTLAAGLAGPFNLSFESIDYGPDRKKPRMIWAWLGDSSELKKIDAGIRKLLQGLPFPIRVEHRPLNPHLTLARFNSLGWEDFEELPAIRQEIKARFPVNSIEIMESQLKRAGPDYYVLQSVKL